MSLFATPWTAALRPPFPSPTTLIYNPHLNLILPERHYFNIMSHSQVLSRQKISQDIIQPNISGIVIGNAVYPHLLNHYDLLLYLWHRHEPEGWTFSNFSIMFLNQYVSTQYDLSSISAQTGDALLQGFTGNTTNRKKGKESKTSNVPLVAEYTHVNCSFKSHQKIWEDSKRHWSVGSVGRATCSPIRELSEEVKWRNTCCNRWKIQS